MSNAGIGARSQRRTDLPASGVLRILRQSRFVRILRLARIGGVFGRIEQAEQQGGAEGKRAYLVSVEKILAAFLLDAITRKIRKDISRIETARFVVTRHGQLRSVRSR